MNTNNENEMKQKWSLLDDQSPFDYRKLNDVMLSFDWLLPVDPQGKGKQGKITLQEKLAERGWCPILWKNDALLALSKQAFAQDDSTKPKMNDPPNLSFQLTPNQAQEILSWPVHAQNPYAQNGLPHELHQATLPIHDSMHQMLTGIAPTVFNMTYDELKAKLVATGTSGKSNPTDSNTNAPEVKSGETAQDRIKLVHHLKLNGEPVQIIQEADDSQINWDMSPAQCESSTLLTVFLGSKDTAGHGGVQFWDPERKRWVAFPSVYSVIVCGGKAVELSQNRLKLGWYRVGRQQQQQQQQQPLITMQYDMFGL